MKKIQNKKYPKRKIRSRIKRLTALALCMILILTWEMPVLAENLTELNRQTEARKETEKQEKQQAEREAALFETKDGITLSENNTEKDAPGKNSTDGEAP